MKHLFLFGFTLFISSLLTAQSSSFQWAKSAKSSGFTDYSYGNSNAIDQSGNVYVTGVFKGIVDFDPGPGIVNVLSNDQSIFISKSDPFGNLLWAKQLGSNNTYYDGANSIVTDGSGNSYITGYFSGTVDFDPGVGTYNLTGFADRPSAFILKLDINGNFVFAKQIKPVVAGYSFCHGNSITLDALGNIYIAGNFNESVDFDPGANTYTLTSGSGTGDVFISKLDINGDFVWAKSMQGNNGSDNIKSIKTDASGNVYTTGQFYGTVDFDPGMATYTLSAFGGYTSGIGFDHDIFISKLSTNGDFIWAKQIGGISSADECYSMSLDFNNNIYLTGLHSNGTDFDPSTGIYTLSSGSSSSESFISKLDANGSFLWAKRLIANSTSYPYGITNDAAGSVYVTGTFYGNSGTDFDPGPSTFNISTFDGDIFISKLDPNGNFRWAVNMGGGLTNQGTSITTDASGSIYTTGCFRSTVDFDPGPGTSTLTAGNNQDMFIQKLNQPGFCVPPSSPSNITLNNYQSICSANTTTLMASSTGTISWYASPTSTLALTTGTNYITPALAAGNYTYYAEAVTCTVSASRTAITVTANAAPIITVNSGAICSGKSFTISPTGASTYTYSSGSAVVNPTTSASYTITGSSAQGCISNNQAVSSVTVNATPTITVNSGSICPGKSFTISPTGASTYTYSSGSAIVNPTTSASYTITGTSAQGCISINPTISSVTVNTTPTITVNSGAICSGKSFTIIPNGASNYTYSGGSAVVSPTSSDSYTVTGTSPQGCISNNQAVSSVTVHTLPTINVSSSNTLMCSGQSAILTATGGVISYTWSTTANTNTIAVSPAINSTYSVSGTDLNGCANTTAFTQSVSICTGLEEKELNTVHIYPNPAHEHLYVIFPEGNYNIQILNPMGQVIIEQHNISSNISLPIQHLTNGIYFIKYFKADQTHIIKFIKE